jgi:hypothetical protein
MGLSILWNLVFFRLAPHPEKELILLLMVGWLLYTISFFICFFVLLKFVSSYDKSLLLLPLLMLLIFYSVLDSPTLFFTAGLVAISFVVICCRVFPNKSKAQL